MTNISCFRSDFRKGCINFFPAVIHRWTGSGYFLRGEHRYFSFTLRCEGLGDGHYIYFKRLGFALSSVSKEAACIAGDWGYIPVWERSPQEGNGNPLQYSCLKNPMDRGARWAKVHGVAKFRKRPTTTKLLAISL